MQVEGLAGPALGSKVTQGVKMVRAEQDIKHRGPDNCAGPCPKVLIVPGLYRRGPGHWRGGQAPQPAAWV